MVLRLGTVGVAGRRRCSARAGRRGRPGHHSPCGASDQRRCCRLRRTVARWRLPTRRVRHRSSRSSLDERSRAGWPVAGGSSRRVQRGTRAARRFRRRRRSEFGAGIGSESGLVGEGRGALAGLSWSAPARQPCFRDLLVWSRRPYTPVVRRWSSRSHRVRTVAPWPPNRGRAGGKRGPSTGSGVLCWGSRYVLSPLVSERYRGGGGEVSGSASSSAVVAWCRLTRAAVSWSGLRWPWGLRGGGVEGHRSGARRW